LKPYRKATMEHYNNEGPDIVKRLAGLISLALFCAGAVLIEYEIAWRVGGAFIFLAGACGLAVVSPALYTAPEGEERADGFHICRRHRRSGIRGCVASSTPASATMDSMSPQQIRQTPELEYGNPRPLYH
jgi:hypothetical protein